MVDRFASSIFLGRSSATVAEICFARQWALVLFALSESSGVQWVATFAYAVVPALAFAQACCWHSVVTLNNLGHAVEEAVWAVTYAVIGVAFAHMSLHLNGTLFYVAVLGVLACICYVYFMVTVDVPMYVVRWRK